MKSKVKVRILLALILFVGRAFSYDPNIIEALNQRSMVLEVNKEPTKCKYFDGSGYRKPDDTWFISLDKSIPRKWSELQRKIEAGTIVQMENGDPYIAVLNFTESDFGTAESKEISCPAFTYSNYDYVLGYPAELKKYDPVKFPGEKYPGEYRDAIDLLSKQDPYQKNLELGTIRRVIKQRPALHLSLSANKIEEPNTVQLSITSWAGSKEMIAGGTINWGDKTTENFGDNEIAGVIVEPTYESTHIYPTSYPYNGGEKFELLGHQYQYTSSGGELYHSYQYPGQYTITAMIKAFEGSKTSTIKTTVRISDQYPEITLVSNNNSIREISTIPVQFTLSDQNKGIIKSITFNVAKVLANGTEELTSIEYPAETRSFSYTFDKRGTYRTWFTATGYDIVSSTNTALKTFSTPPKTFQILDITPKIVVFHANNRVRDRSSEPVQFNIADQNKGEIKELQLHIQEVFSNGNKDLINTLTFSGNTRNVQHAFTRAGNFNVWFTAIGYDVVDPAVNNSPLRSFSTTPVTYTIKEIAPVTTLTVELDRENAPVTVTATPSNSGGSVDKWEWNWGDETVETVTTAAAQVHTYKKKGTYTITVKAIGPDYSHLSSQTIEVKMNDMTPINMLLLD